MSPEDLTQVRASLACLAPRQAEVVRAYHQYLAQVSPRLRAHFPPDPTAEGLADLAAFAAIVAMFDCPAERAAAVAALRERLIGAGFQPADYLTLGIVWIAHLEVVLAADWTPALHRAWVAAVQTVEKLLVGL